MEAARYSEDVGFDVRMVVLVARRLLSTQEMIKEPKVAAFAIELLADHAITIRGDSVDQPDRPNWLVSSVDEPGRFAEELSRAGFSVSLLGVDERRRLVRVTAQDGKLGQTVRLEQDVSFGARFETWSKTYPYQYGMVDRFDTNVFYMSMQALGLDLPACQRGLLVVDASLQQLPPNLILVEGELIGAMTAMAATPSLSWLKAIRGANRKYNGQGLAWISTAVNDENDGTLRMVADRLEPTLREHGIPLDTGPRLPKDMAGAELAIVTAHGGIAPEGRYFHVLADEATLRETPISVAQALANVGVVVLFVCSGGRFDKHPFASTTVGLPKELLDRGCVAVVASPWPLDPRVTYHWLPAFLDAWNSGEPVIDANFKANKAVEAAMGNLPQLCLAMTVFGDPLATKGFHQLPPMPPSI